ncbi:RNA polymerase sigma factor [Kitasatospora phosalacinea]|uniref:RNA polymerase sigma factor n=1 Tax=Kitasatospora phosalacinea TaxID=2065 RepID=UPI003669E2EF
MLPRWPRWLARFGGPSRTAARPATARPATVTRLPAAPREEHLPPLGELFTARRLDMVRLARFLVDDLPTAEDVVQDAFATICRVHGSTLDGLQDPWAYLQTAVLNAARSVLRRRRTVRAHTFPHPADLPDPVDLPHPTDAPPVDEGLLLAEEHREVIAALRQLTRRQREVLVLRYWSELTEAQIAQSLGISRGTVKSTASRALDVLEKKLAADR